MITPLSAEAVSLFAAEAIQEFVRTHEQPVSIHRRACVEAAAVAQFIARELLELRLGGEHEAAAVAREGIDAPARQHWRGVELSGIREALFIDQFAGRHLDAIGDAQVLVQPVEMPLVQQR